eukprot:755432-Hanusia_phi.AAC.5
MWSQAAIHCFIAGLGALLPAHAYTVKTGIQLRSETATVTASNERMFYHQYATALGQLSRREAVRGFCVALENVHMCDIPCHST